MEMGGRHVGYETREADRLVRLRLMRLTGRVQVSKCTRFVSRCVAQFQRRTKADLFGVDCLVILLGVPVLAFGIARLLGLVRFLVHLDEQNEIGEDDQNAEHR